MKKISLFLSMVAFVSLVAISPASAQKAAPKKATTTQPAPAAKKACCSDPKAANCTMGKDGKTCTEMKKTASTTPAPAPKAK